MLGRRPEHLMTKKEPLKGRLFPLEILGSALRTARE
jgi:hypothetical protein